MLRRGARRYGRAVASTLYSRNEGAGCSIIVAYKYTADTEFFEEL